MSLSGKIYSKYYVLVTGPQATRRLDQLGGYGIQISNLRGKGPLDRQLANLDTGPPAGCSIILSLHEAYHLQQLSSLSIKSEDTDQYLTREVCWAQFSAKHKNFAQEYAVFRYFRLQGWIVKCGYNYGAEFLLYKNIQTHEHARYVVLLLPENKSHGWQSLLTINRVVQSVKKDLLLCYVKNDSMFDVRNPECVDNISISSYKFLAHPNITVVDETGAKVDTCSADPSSNTNSEMPIN